MKRLLTFLFITTILSTSATFGQRSNVHRTNYTSTLNSYERQELKKFDRQSDKFSYSLMVGDNWSARKHKVRILRLMENEILETENELNRFTYNSSSYSKRGNNRIYRSREHSVYSKNRGRRADYYREQHLIDRLEKQIRLRNRFEDTQLIGSRRGILVNERIHRKVMYKFRDTMTEEYRYNYTLRRG